MRRAKGAFLAMLGLASGCAVGIGQECSDALPCPTGLACARPTLSGGVVSELGFCDYPLRGEGEPCTRAAQCESTLTCSNHFRSGSRYGACVPRRAAGEACFRNRDCTSNSCQGASGTALDGTCG